ncbi:MAG: dolichyl-phosphate beta-glucosyltransferase [Patescibacteria group bacterium]|nr:dolichyl-phosphate beta-glucosyltransferase [Patescibacteria group bacterium]
MNTSFSENQNQKNPKLTVIIPTFNESNRITETLESVREFLITQSYDHEVIIVDDGSVDDTVEKIKEYTQEDANFKIITYQPNKGKGNAVKTGVLNAKGEYVVYMDADNSTKISEVDKLWPHTKDYDVVFGSRHHPEATIHIRQAIHRIILSRLSNLLIRVLLLPNIYDTQCGFKLFKTDVAKKVFSKNRLNRFGFDFEVLAMSRNMGYKIKEVGVDWYNDSDSKVRAGREALRTLKDLLRVRFWLWFGGYN